MHLEVTLVPAAFVLGLVTDKGRGTRRPQQHGPSVTALGSGPLGHTSAAIACFGAAHLCVELHRQLRIPPSGQGAAPVRQGTEPCLFTGYLSSVVSARKWKRYWKINTSVTRLARKDCLGARSMRRVWGVRVSKIAIPWV